MKLTEAQIEAVIDLSRDLGEQVDFSVRYSDVARTMRAKLEAWRQTVGARMPTRNPKHAPERAEEWWSRRTQKPVDIERMAEQYRSRN